jgi:hypothetical protein
MALSQDKILFQPRFGSKTDGKGRDSYVQPKQTFYANECWAVNVPRIVRCYLQLTKKYRKSETALLLSARDGHSPASAQTIAGWVRSRLEMAGVSASAGSTRSAVATSACLAGCRVQDVMDNGNWRQERTLLRHYLRPPK